MVKKVKAFGKKVKTFEENMKRHVLKNIVILYSEINKESSISLAEGRIYKNGKAKYFDRKASTMIQVLQPLTKELQAYIEKASTMNRGSFNQPLSN